MKDSRDGKILSKRIYLQKLKLFFYKIKDAFLSWVRFESSEISLGLARNEYELEERIRMASDHIVEPCLQLDKGLANILI